MLPVPTYLPTYFLRTTKRQVELTDQRKNGQDKRKNIHRQTDRQTDQHNARTKRWIVWFLSAALIFVLSPSTHQHFCQNLVGNKFNLPYQQVTYLNLLSGLNYQCVVLSLAT